MTLAPLGAPPPQNRALMEATAQEVIGPILGHIAALTAEVERLRAAVEAARQGKAIILLRDWPEINEP